MQAQALPTTELAQQQFNYLWNDLMTQSQAHENSAAPEPRFGFMAEQYGELLPLQVYCSAAGFYIGTYSERGPFTRESEEYWRKEDQAEQALATGKWTQRYDV